ncbi:mitogen-activated protein kinase kinase 2 isoform X1 [Canna indica]|uniref:mitogen-activated protein kinase kinase n=1 Tax=Canna indica TaxID=4628 RepID=A0AAQ3KGU5_9LILI|nr:mitogen-activated protein kinase kinase 2 isoform X1 [Canna indica]
MQRGNVRYNIPTINYNFIYNCWCKEVALTCSCADFSNARQSNTSTTVAVRFDIYGSKLLANEAFFFVDPASCLSRQSTSFATIIPTRLLPPRERRNRINQWPRGLGLMRKGGLNPGLRLSLPSHEDSISQFLTQSGTFKDGDLLVNKDGLRIVSHSEEARQPVVKPTENQLNLEDMDAVKVIGKGNGGIVQLVRHKWTGQFFALKVIELNIQDSARRQIAQELRISMSTQCPYIIVCYQCFYYNGVISVVLEYMDGGSLADFLKSVKTIPEPYLAAICNQVLEGLVYLHHEKRIIHRDIKPSNILINHRGEVKISDFGVSAIIASSSGQRDTFTGTYNYMSPERIATPKHGYISDIWSFGLVMLECATGQFPYPQCDSFYELLDTIVEQPSPCASPEHFSPEFCSFISLCLQKKPKDRKSARVLLKHPFLSMYNDLNVDLSAYFTNSGLPLSQLLKE